MLKLKYPAAIGLILLATSAYAAENRGPPDRPPSQMTSSEIKAFNEGLATVHPQYIRCRKTELIGSLVKKLRVCRTNEQWKAAVDNGNANAREMLEAMSKAPVNSN
jgi:hypothetical protein